MMHVDLSSIGTKAHYEVVLSNGEQFIRTDKTNTARECENANQTYVMSFIPISSQSLHARKRSDNCGCRIVQQFADFLTRK